MPDCDGPGPDCFTPHLGVSRACIIQVLRPEDDPRDTQDPKVALEAASSLRMLGNACWKESAAADALAKWQKALRYLNVQPKMRRRTSSSFPATPASSFRSLHSLINTIF